MEVKLDEIRIYVYYIYIHIHIPIPRPSKYPLNGILPRTLRTAAIFRGIWRIQVYKYIYIYIMYIMWKHSFWVYMDFLSGIEHCLGGATVVLLELKGERGNHA